MDVLQFPGHDGVQLAYRENRVGPLILLHGFMGTGSDWLHQGPGDTLAETGFRLVLPDFRGHGQSPRPHDLPAYPPDVLADDGLALIRHLGLGAGEYDLGGYSLGGRIVVRMLARGAEPGRAVVAGQGLAKIAGRRAPARTAARSPRSPTGSPCLPTQPTPRWRTGPRSSAPTPGRCCACWARSSPRPRTTCARSRPRRSS